MARALSLALEMDERGAGRGRRGWRPKKIAGKHRHDDNQTRVLGSTERYANTRTPMVIHPRKSSHRSSGPLVDNAAILNTVRLPS